MRKAVSATFSAVALFGTFVYALYAACTWFIASIGFWKGSPLELTPPYIVVLYVLPTMGMTVTSCAASAFPQWVDPRVAYVICWLGGATLAACVALAVLPIARISL